MPQLVLFVPCEKAIVGPEGLSLVNVLQTLTIEIKEASASDPSVTEPRSWSIVTQWRKQDGDDDKRFQQEVTVKAPNDEILLRAITEFEMSKQFHRLIGTVRGFPANLDGEYVVAIRIRGVNDAAWTAVASYPLIIKVRKVSAHESSSS